MGDSFFNGLIGILGTVIGIVLTKSIDAYDQRKKNQKNLISVKSNLRQINAHFTSALMLLESDEENNSLTSENLKGELIELIASIEDSSNLKYFDEQRDSLLNLTDESFGLIEEIVIKIQNFIHFHKRFITILEPDHIYNANEMELIIGEMNNISSNIHRVIERI